jgi:hypothetical protein
VFSCGPITGTAASARPDAASATPLVPSSMPTARPWATKRPSSAVTFDGDEMPSANRIGAGTVARMNARIRLYSHDPSDTMPL